MRIMVTPAQTPIADQCAALPLPSLTIPNSSKVYNTSISAVPGSGMMISMSGYVGYIGNADQTSIITNTPQ